MIDKVKISHSFSEMHNKVFFSPFLEAVESDWSKEMEPKDIVS